MLNDTSLELVGMHPIPPYVQEGDIVSEGIQWQEIASTSENSEIDPLPDPPSEPSSTPSSTSSFETTRLSDAADTNQFIRLLINDFIESILTSLMTEQNDKPNDYRKALLDCIAEYLTEKQDKIFLAQYKKDLSLKKLISIVLKSYAKYIIDDNYNAFLDDVKFRKILAACAVFEGNDEILGFLFKNKLVSPNDYVQINTSGICCDIESYLIGGIIINTNRLDKNPFARSRMIQIAEMCGRNSNLRLVQGGESVAASSFVARDDEYRNQMSKETMRENFITKVFAVCKNLGVNFTAGEMEKMRQKQQRHNVKNDCIMSLDISETNEIDSALKQKAWEDLKKNDKLEKKSTSSFLGLFPNVEYDFSSLHKERLAELQKEAHFIVYLFLRCLKVKSLGDLKQKYPNWRQALGEIYESIVEQMMVTVHNANAENRTIILQQNALETAITTLNYKKVLANLNVSNPVISDFFDNPKLLQWLGIDSIITSRITYFEYCYLRAIFGPRDKDMVDFDSTEWAPNITTPWVADNDHEDHIFYIFTEKKLIVFRSFGIVHKINVAEDPLLKDQACDETISPLLMEHPEVKEVTFRANALNIMLKLLNKFPEELPKLFAFIATHYFPKQDSKYAYQVMNILLSEYYKHFFPQPKSSWSNSFNIDLAENAEYRESYHFIHFIVGDLLSLIKECDKDKKHNEHKEYFENILRLTLLYCRAEISEKITDDFNLTNNPIIRSHQLFMRMVFSVKGNGQGDPNLPEMLKGNCPGYDSEMIRMHINCLLHDRICVTEEGHISYISDCTLKTREIVCKIISLLMHPNSDKPLTPEKLGEYHITCLRPEFERDSFYPLKIENYAANRILNIGRNSDRDPDHMVDVGVSNEPPAPIAAATRVAIVDDVCSVMRC